jgi:stearoyl-CoA desaturase (delta-9 desaturase)
VLASAPLRQVIGAAGNVGLLASVQRTWTAMITIDHLYGILQLNFWGYVLATVVMIHITLIAVTLYLHRDATHRSVNLHPTVRHFFRFWLWLTTGMITKEWVAVHRKHHARCETAEDPHSPVIHGLKKLLLEGAELYRAAIKDHDMLIKYGRGAPDDWIERNLYRHRFVGIVILVIADLLLFGIPGITIIGVQLIAIPFLAAGVVNGVGHHTGYRNFECPDASRNMLPWGILIAGEELHNNHHAFPSSAKFSIRPWEFDIGWMYLRLFQTVGLAKVIRTAPQPLRGLPSSKHIDLETARAVIVNRMHVLRDYARNVTAAVYREHVSEQGLELSRQTRKLLSREPLLLDDRAQSKLQVILASCQRLKTVHEYREQLRLLWCSNMSNERLLAHLKDWVARAEASGICVLQDFAASLRAYAMA